MKRAVAQDAAHLTVFEYVGAVMGTPNPSYSPYQGFSGIAQRLLSSVISIASFSLRSSLSEH